MKIYLFGASGSGVTTLGQALAERLQVPYFDADDFYWAPAEQPFTVKRPLPERNQLLAEALARHPAWVLGGSLVSWGEQWLHAFDLAVFLWLPPNIRLARLQQREQERYGELLRTDAFRQQQSAAFLDWAATYDTGGTTSRSLAIHTAWMQQLKCPVLELRGDLTVAERVARVVDALPAA
ncbi:hypothetical protein [Hymenobacter sp. 102]|uniref:hypothetical protein n=1 Tax=Hymenobacter sp. 102 TaxID=3403152 RepID=UPI003CEADF18